MGILTLSQLEVIKRDIKTFELKADTIYWLQKHKINTLQEAIEFINYRQNGSADIPLEKLTIHDSVIDRLNNERIFSLLDFEKHCIEELNTYKGFTKNSHAFLLVKSMLRDYEYIIPKDRDKHYFVYNERRVREIEKALNEFEIDRYSQRFYIPQEEEIKKYEKCNQKYFK